MKLKEQFNDLVAPVKYVDGKIHRAYQKLTKKWEEKGYSKYILAHAFNLSTIPTGIYLESNFNRTDSEWNLLFALGSLMGLEFARNTVEPMIKKDITEDKTITIDPFLYILKKADMIRLPLFALGLGFIAKGGINLINYIQNQNPDSLNNTLYELSLGYSLFGNASSMYVKNSNPKLLEKQSMYKDALDLAKRLLPKPIPGLVTVETYSSLENKLN